MEIIKIRVASIPLLNWYTVYVNKEASIEYIQEVMVGDDVLYGVKFASGSELITDIEGVQELGVYLVNTKE